MSESVPYEQRYDRLDEANRNSWYMNEVNRPFSVFLSLHSAGPERLVPGPGASDEEIDEIRRLNRPARTLTQYATGKFARVELAGNVSTVRRPDGTTPYGPGDMTDRGRYRNGLANMRRFLGSEGIDIAIANVRVLNPERDYATPLTVVNIDDDPGEYKGGEPVLLQTHGDFVYTRNPDIAVRIGPADCPIAVISAETPEGPILIVVHFAWRGPLYGQYDDMERELDNLGVVKESIRAYITPGGHGETFTFTNYVVNDEKFYPQPVEGEMFQNVKEHVDEGGKTTYSFGMDVPLSTYNALRKYGLREDQLFIDTTDTTDQRVGLASHSRSARPYGDNGKTADDLVRTTIIVKQERSN